MVLSPANEEKIDARRWLKLGMMIFENRVTITENSVIGYSINSLEDLINLVDRYHFDNNPGSK